MKCPNCGYEQKDDATACICCKKPFPSYITGRINTQAGNSPLPTSMAAKRERKQELRKKRQRDKRNSHAITGALTFAVLAIALDFPNSLAPLKLLVILPFSAIFGLPLGYFISMRGGGAVQGALLASGAFALLWLTISLPAILQSSDPFLIVLNDIFFGLLCGLLPGAIIGFHVQADNL